MQQRQKRYWAKYRLWAYSRKLARIPRLQPVSPRIGFLIIGSAKCGTTSLHKYLNLHPDIYLPAGVGINDETGYFLPNDDERVKALTNRDIRRDMPDLVLLERILEGYAGERLIGEETTDYTKRPYRTVKFDEIGNHNPDMKFILLARDPIDKLFSQYRHFLRYGAIEAGVSFTQELARYDYYRYSSAYFYQLEPYLERFGRDRIHISLLEDLRENPKREMSEILNFLEVDEGKFPATQFLRHNVNPLKSELEYSLEAVPASVLEFISDDAEKLETLIQRDLRSIWPNFASIRG